MFVIRNYSFSLIDDQWLLLFSVKLTRKSNYQKWMKTFSYETEYPRNTKTLSVLEHQINKTFYACKSIFPKIKVRYWPSFLLCLTIRRRTGNRLQKSLIYVCSTWAVVYCEYLFISEGHHTICNWIDCWIKILMVGANAAISEKLGPETIEL